MRKTKLYFLFLLVGCLWFVNCQQSKKVPSTLDQTNLLVTEAKVYLDSIKNLVAAEKWYAAHTATIKFKSTFPTEFQNEINVLNKEIRHSFNTQTQKVANNRSQERQLGKSIQDLRKDRNELKQRTFYHALSATPYLNEDAVQAYLSIPFDTLRQSNLHFIVQNLSLINYEIQYVQFEADGLIHPYLPKETYTDNNLNHYWQWFDDEVETAQSMELLEQLSRAKEAKIIIYFQQNYKKIRLLSAEEKQGLLSVLTAFKELK